MKKKHIAIMFLVFITILETIKTDELEYNFQIKDGENTLMVKKNNEKSKMSKTNTKRSKKLQSKKKKKSNKKKHSIKNSKTLKRMIKLGTLIDRITDRLSKKDDKTENTKLVKNANKSKPRKAFGMGAALGAGAAVGGAALVGGAMAGAADNAKLEVEIDKNKMKQVMVAIKVDLSEEMNDLLNKSNRGFSTMKKRVETITANLEQKIAIAEDNIQNVLATIDSIYNNGDRAINRAMEGGGAAEKKK